MTYMRNVNCDFSIIGFSGTWLNSPNIDTYGIDGYSHAGRTREMGKGGGLLLFICDKMVYCEMPEITLMRDHIECVFVKINCKDNMLIVGVAYRPPNSNTVDFIDYWYYDILEKVAHYPCYIVRDLNLDLLEHELHRPTETFLDIMYAYSYIPMINRSTRVTRDTCTLIDNIFTNNYSISSNFFSGILKADITDHYILFHIITAKDGKKDDSIGYKTVRIVNESCTNQFIEKIQNANCPVLNSYRDWNIFIKILRIVQNYLWWNISTYKNKLYRISVKHPISYNISKCKNYKNKLFFYFKERRKMYYQTEIVSNKIKLKKAWTIIKQVINRNRSSKIHDKFMYNNREITDPQTIANGFNNYFVNIGPILASKLPDNNLSHKKFLLENIRTSLILNPTTETEIKNVISQLKEGAPGRDGGASENIKHIKDSISCALPNIVNLSFEQGVLVNLNLLI